MVCKLEGQTRQVWLHGQVVSAETNQPVPLAQIASFMKVKIFAADSAGEFRIILDANDSIKVVALGFEPLMIGLDTMNIEADIKYLFKLKRTSYLIRQIDVHYSPEYSSYMDKLKAQAYTRSNSTNLNLPDGIELGRQPDVPVDILPTYRKNPPAIAAFFQPANVLYYYTSKSEKQKRKMMKLLKFEKQRQMMTVDMMQEVSGLVGEPLEEFIKYCNANIKFSERDTPLSIKYKVVDLLNEYNK